MKQLNMRLIGEPDALRNWPSERWQGLELVGSHVRTDRLNMSVVNVECQASDGISCTAL